MYSTCGVFPVPPVVMFPTEMIGISKDCDLKNPNQNTYFETKLPYHTAEKSVTETFLLESYNQR